MYRWNVKYKYHLDREGNATNAGKCYRHITLMSYSGSEPPKPTGCERSTDTSTSQHSTTSTSILLPLNEDSYEGVSGDLLLCFYGHLLELCARPCLFFNLDVH